MVLFPAAESLLEEVPEAEVATEALEAEVEVVVGLVEAVVDCEVDCFFLF